MLEHQLTILDLLAISLEYVWVMCQLTAPSKVNRKNFILEYKRRESRIAKIFRKLLSSLVEGSKANARLRGLLRHP